MKSSIHLFYGIIIGILVCACSGSLKDGKAEFEEVEIKDFTVWKSPSDPAANPKHTLKEQMAIWKNEGWTFIDYEFFEGKSRFKTSFLVGK